MKILIFTEMKVGEGHYQAALAISKELEDVLASVVEIKLCSGMRVIHPLVEWLSVTIYFLILKVYPPFWRLIYTKVRAASKLQTQIFARRLLNVVNKENPDLIICTHPACIQGLAYLKEKGLISCPLSVIGTDYGFHSVFVSEYVDFYFVAHEKLKEKLMEEHKLDPRRIFAYGIPLHTSFDLVPRDDYSSRIRILTEQKIHIVVLGGATCQLPIKKIIQVFTPYQASFKLTIITGHNRKLYQRLIRSGLPDFVEVLGYVRNMHEWLSDADLVLTKPGGLTVSEALACGRPCLLINPIPGHEENNKEFLIEQQVALFVSQLETLPNLIFELNENPAYWQKWQAQLASFPVQNARKRIVETLVKSQ